MSVRAWGLTDVGRKRKHNEDSFLIDHDLGLFVVADGMGGHAAGEVASARCVEIVRDAIAGHRSTLESFARDPSPKLTDAVQGVMEWAIQKACAEIYELASKDSSMRGMGTTCVALLLVGGKGVVGHVGDSRVYLRRQDRAHQLTEDHSLIHEQLKRGVITREEAEKSEFRNVITRAVGIQRSVQVDTLVVDVLPGDTLLLCSDGLHNYLAAGEAAKLLSQDPVEQLPRRLVDFANERGGKDNITVVVVSTGGTPSAAAAAEVDAKLEVLRRIPLFQYMTYKELLSVLSTSRGRHYRQGERVISEGDGSNEMFVIARGRVNVQKGSTTIAELRSGGHFGEMGLVDQAPRSATVVALEPTSALVFDREDVLKLMRRDSLLAVKLLWSFSQVMAERLRHTNEALSGLQVEMERLRGSEMPAPEKSSPVPFGEE